MKKNPNPKRVVEFHVYSDLAHSSAAHEGENSTLAYARRHAASIRRMGWNTTIRACVERDLPGGGSETWCETVEQVTQDGRVIFRSDEYPAPEGAS